MSPARSLIAATVALSLLAAPALAQFPSIPRPKLPSVKPPNIPNPIDEARKAAEEARRRAEEAARKAAEEARRRAEEAARKAADEARKQAARIDDLRRQADRVVRDFRRMKEEAEKVRRDFDRISGQVQSKDPGVQRRAYEGLKAMGVLGGNKGDVMKGIDRGLGVVVWAKEFDHFEQIELASALGASVATANPGPALVYLKQFAAQTKTAVLRSLRGAPARLREKVEAEFETLLVRGLDAAVNGKRPPGFGIDGVDIKVDVATYNHWVNVRLNTPRLVPTEKILGVQMYRIDTGSDAKRVPLPNTFQPYLRLVVRAR